MGNALESICMSGYNEGNTILFIIIKRKNNNKRVKLFQLLLLFIIIMFRYTIQHNNKKGI